MWSLDLTQFKHEQMQPTLLLPEGLLVIHHALNDGSHRETLD